MRLAFRMIISPLLVLSTVSSLSHGQEPGSASQSNAAIVEETPAQVRSEEAKDPRLKALSASDQKAYLDEGASSIQYCTNNVTLNGFYSCSCFSKTVFDERMKTIGQTVRVADASRGTAGRRQATPFVNLVFKLDISACVAPAKIPAYASNRTNQVLQPDPTVSPAQRDQISACVSSALTSSFVAEPVPNMSAIDGLFNTALVRCREQITSGNRAAIAPQNPGSNSPQSPGRPATTATPNPVQQRAGGLFGRLNGEINRANGAIQHITGSHPAITAASNQPANTGAHPSATTATNQRLNANTALFMAIIRDDVAGCANAIAQGADVNSLNGGVTLLITAARQGLPVTQCLVDHGADINEQVIERGNPMTPVWAAAESKHFDVMDYLVEKGVPVNATSGDEMSLLLFAVGDGGTLSDVKLLVEHGADVNYVQKRAGQPHTALRDSIQLHKSDITAYLQTHGAHQ